MGQDRSTSQHIMPCRKLCFSLHGRRCSCGFRLASGVGQYLEVVEGMLDLLAGHGAGRMLERCKRVGLQELASDAEFI
ncbi:hypothetical protein O3P69_007690 [Scylla paramamosain]|uniref:Uncharacterized protein n=1 Tax=Scylla paramamosain TaxID=85552 RepID=A0AAW0V1X8_SCYPA